MISAGGFRQSTRLSQQIEHINLSNLVISRHNHSQHEYCWRNRGALEGGRRPTYASMQDVNPPKLTICYCDATNQRNMNVAFDFSRCKT